MDVYRMEDETEELGLEEYFYGEGVSVIEWPSMISTQLPEDRLIISLFHLGESSRKIMIHSMGKRSLELSKELQS
jgi:tRNA threonylcarbamoyladenosine biosynthesis protein TsaE